MKNKVGKKALSSKEKREIALIFGSVLLVAFVGLIVTFKAAGTFNTIAGAAVHLNPDVPTYSGSLVLLKDYCGVVKGDGSSCDNVCGSQRVCVPVEENCDQAADSCLCCSSP